MKKILMASAVVVVTAMAGDMEFRPEASVPTPVEARETLNNIPKLSEKENVDWQKMREERRVAREQILQNLRSNSAAEKKDMREVSMQEPAIETPVQPIDKNLEKPKDELVREKKMENVEPFRRHLENGPFGTPIGRPDKKVKEPLHPFNPHERRNYPIVEPIKPLGWGKGYYPSK